MTDRNGSVEVIDAMMKRLPPVGSEWPLDQRVLWLQAMESVLHMVYGPAERIEVRVDGPEREEMLARLRDMPPAKIIVKDSAEPTDKALAGADDAGSGSGNASTTEAPAETRMGGEWSSSAETDSGEKAPSEPDPPIDAQLRKRPPGLPSNLALAVEAIGELGPASASQIKKWVCRKYWSMMPDGWDGCLYNFVREGKLARQGINFVLPEPRQLPSVKKPQLPAKHPAPKPPPARAAVIFEHNGEKIELPTMRHYVVASKLKAAMGKGYVDPAFLASSVIGSNTERHRDDIVACAIGLNGPLAQAGLKVENHKGFGLVMREIEA